MGFAALAPAELSIEHEDTFEDIEKKIILMYLDYYDGNRTKAAKHLKIGVRTIQRKLHIYGLANPQMKEK